MLLHAPDVLIADTGDDLDDGARNYEDFKEDDELMIHSYNYDDEFV